MIIIPYHPSQEHLYSDNKLTLETVTTITIFVPCKNLWYGVEHGATA